MNRQCETMRWQGRGRQRHQIRCDGVAAWKYVNGAYRRLECDACAEQTRPLIRYPDVIRLERLDEPGSQSAAGGEGAE